MPRKKGNNKRTIKGEVARKACVDFPSTPSLTLAKKIYKDNPELFLDIEDARSKIRYYRGALGKKSREEATRSGTLVPRIELPESESEPASVWKLPSGYKKVLVLSDVHIPYQDNDAIKAAVEYGKKEKVDAVYLNGDILDFYQLSFHEKDPRKRSVSYEIESGIHFFQWLRQEIDCPIYYIPGNHEKRLERYLMKKAPELLDCHEFKLDILLKLGEIGVQYLPHGSKVYFGKLLVEHGDKLRGSGGVNPARTLSLKFKRSVLCGHFHRTSNHVSKVYDDTIFTCHSLGCLCELEPGYFPVNEHNHGFAIVEMNGEEFTVYNHIINEGHVY